MTREEIIDGLKFTVGMFLFDPLTGETIIEPKNDMDKITIDACKGAIELLEQEWHKELPKKNGRYLVWWCDKIEIANYADNLYKVDKYVFRGKERAGWYNYDDEYGNYELEDVLRWQELPSDYKEDEENE